MLTQQHMNIFTTKTNKMKNLELIMLGCVVVGYIVGKLHTSWKYYKKTGVFIEDVKDKFSDN